MTKLKIHKTKSILLIVMFMIFATVSNGLIAQELEPLKLRLGDVSMNKLPFILAYDAGIFEQNGLNLQPMFTRGSVNIIRRSGVEVPEEFILKGDEVTPIRIGGAVPSIVRLTTRAGAPDPIILGSSHLVSGYSGVGAVTHMYAVTFALEMGWDPRFDISLLADALGVEALKNGHIDAMIGPELHSTMAIDAGFRELEDLSTYNIPIAGSAFLVDRGWLRNNRDMARRFIKSAVEALAMLKTDKDASFQTMAKWYQLDEPELMEHFYDEAAKVPRKPYPPVEGIRKVMELYDSHEMRKYTLEHFYDDTFVRELDDSGYIDSLYE
jgi:ABC-type nitrate/sulfonate/bicarbonate transport system substrate-binding protein